MTKEAYLEMCSQLGTNPVESEIPVELGDLPFEVQQAYHIYSILPEKTDTFNNRFLGKSLEYAPTMMELMNIDDKVEVFKVLLLIDPLERAEVNRKRQNGR